MTVVAEMTCRACDEDCEATYVCLLCGEEKNLCATMVGGFDDPKGVCACCFRRLMLSAVAAE